METSPVDAHYEYMVIPGASPERMEELDQEIRSGQKPYAVFQKNRDAHILRHHTRGIRVCHIQCPGRL